MNMLIQLKARLLFSLAFMIGISWLSSLHSAVLTGVDPTIISVGTGVDISFLVIDESTLYSTPLEFVYHYTYDANNPLTGYDLLKQVTNSTPLVLGTTTFSFGDSLTSLTYGGNPVTSTTAPDFSSGTYWSYYLSGGLDGAVDPASPSQWNYANNGMGSRSIAPGSWDGWSFASWGTSGVDTPPSVSISAVPEPAIIPLTLLSVATLFLFTRWKTTTPKEII